MKTDLDRDGAGGWFDKGRGQQHARSQHRDQKRGFPLDDEKRSQWGDCVSHIRKEKETNELTVAQIRPIKKIGHSSFFFFFQGE